MPVPATPSLPQQPGSQPNMKHLLFAAAAATQQQQNAAAQPMPGGLPPNFGAQPAPQMVSSVPQHHPAHVPQSPQSSLGAARPVKPAEPQSPFLLSATVSLVEHLDKKLMVILRDGRKFVGILRSFDQFANIVLQRTVERIWVGNKFSEKPLGVFLIRGENVVLVGEVDEDKEDQLVSGTQRWSHVDLKTIQELDKQDREVRVEQLKIRRKLLLSRGLTSIGQSTGYSLFGGFGIDVFQDDTTI